MSLRSVIWVWDLLYESEICYMSLRSVIWVWDLLYEFEICYMSLRSVIWVWDLLYESEICFVLGLLPTLYNYNPACRHSYIHKKILTHTHKYTRIILIWGWIVLEHIYNGVEIFFSELNSSESLHQQSSPQGWSLESRISISRWSWSRISISRWFWDSNCRKCLGLVSVSPIVINVSSRITFLNVSVSSRFR